MKKQLCFVIAACFAVSTLVLPQPARAAEVDGTALAITIGIMALIIVPVALAVSSGSEENSKRETEFKKQLEDINSIYSERLGNWTFDEMMMDLGKPEEVTEGDSIKIAVYDKRSAKTVSDTEYESGNFLAKATSKTK